MDHDADKGRAYRRAQIARLKRNRRSYQLGFASTTALGRIVHTATVCSCWMCGNPRRHLGEQTIQERSFYQARLHAEA